MARREAGATSVTPIDPGIVARISRGVRYVLTGDSKFFGAGQPLPPSAQEETVGRRFDYPAFTNLNYRPRANEPIGFADLRQLADSYDLLRLAIETRKDQFGKLRWQVNRRDGKKQDAKAKEIQAFLEEPDREQDFLGWKRMLLEDLLVIDAPTVYVRRTKGGQPYAFDVMDGATIKPVLDGTGRTPQPPDPAFQQIIKGLPTSDYSRDELLYKPRNRRPNKIYGYSPVEQVLMTVNIALRRQISQLEYYTEGNIPDMFYSVPEDWSPKQIQEMQIIFDELLSDTATRRKVRFMPGGGTAHETKDEALFDQYDEWLARIISYAFSLPPTAFVKQMNRATSENAQDVALEEGLSPLMEWDVSFMNRLIRVGWQTTDYVFAWVKELDIDPYQQAQIDEIHVKNKIRRVNEVREDHGWEADAELEQLQLAPPPAPFGGTDPTTADNPPNPNTTQAPGDGTEKTPSTAKVLKARARSRGY
jgi:hypothetical protein